MNTGRKISPFQIFAIMMLSRTVALFTFVIPSASEMPVFDRALSSIIIILFELLYSLVVFSALTRSGGQGIIPYISKFSQSGAKISSLLYALGFIWFAGISIARFEIFISTVMFPNAELQIMAVLLIAAAAVSAVKGIEPLARTAVIIFVILFVSITAITISSLDEFKYTNLKPPFAVGLANHLRFAVFVSVRSAELPSILITAPYVKGSIKKSTAAWIIFFGLASLVLLTVLSGVTGEFGDEQMFQLYTLTTIAKIGILERMDDILIGMWVVCAMIKTAYFIIAAGFAAEQGFKIKNGNAACIAAAAGIFTVYSLSSKTVLSFTRLAGSPVIAVIYALLTLVIPLSTAAAGRSKKRRLT